MVHGNGIEHMFYYYYVRALRILQYLYMFFAIVAAQIYIE